MLSDGAVVIRDWREADAPELAVQANDRRVWLGLRDVFPHPYSIEDARAFISMAMGMSPRTFLAIEVAGHVSEAVLRQSVIKDGQVLDQVVYACLRS